MRSTKTNNYTGQEYECSCDYSYTCNGCIAVRKAYQLRLYERELKEWMVAAIEKVAEASGVTLGERPVDPGGDD